MLTLARESRGRTQRELAEALGISQGQLSKIEAGVLMPSTAVLRKCATVLSYPELFFVQGDAVYGPGTSEFFHRKRRAVSSRVLGKIHAAINIRRMNVARLLRSADLPEPRIFHMDLDEFDSVGEIARAVRATWHLPRGPVKDLTRAIEDAGGLVITADLETPLVDAVSQWIPGLPPMFFINESMPGDRSRLSLAHELGHLVMHQAPRPAMEEEAMTFAAEFLMPEQDIRPQLADVSVTSLAALKPYWKVSMAALLHRAQELRCITERKARSLWMDLGKAGYRQEEPPELEVAREQPALLREMLRLHQRELGYTTAQLAELLLLTEDDLTRVFDVEDTVEDRRNGFRVLTPVS